MQASTIAIHSKMLPDVGTARHETEVNRALGANARPKPNAHQVLLWLLQANDPETEGPWVLEHQGAKCVRK